MEESSKEIINLLEQVNLIKFKYDKIIDSHQFDFNVFTILRNENDEVNLHSMFLYIILNPKGSHHKGDLFLQYFLKAVGIYDFSLLTDKIAVEKEYQGIDILIKNQSDAIIIENKICADDQVKQLERYYKIIEKEGFNNIKIIYLTLHGDEPDDQSLGELNINTDKLLKLISYKEDINNWLNDCIKECALHPILRETLVQYQILIQKLTGKYHTMGYIMEIKKLLIDENRIRLASDLSQAFTDAKIEIQFDFWQDTIRELKLLEYKVDDSMCTKKEIEDYYYKSKNNKYYGLGISVNEGIEDNLKLLFWIEIDWKIYYGFRVINEKDILDQLDVKFDRIADIIKSIDACFSRNKWWLGWKYSNKDFNFKTFNDELIFSLANIDKRRKYTNELANEIHEIIKKFNLFNKN